VGQVSAAARPGELDAGQLLQAAAMLAGAADALAAVADRGQGAVAGLGGGAWSGAARDGFMDVWVRRRANLDALAAAWREGAALLRGLAMAVELAEAGWRAAAAEADRLGLVLTATGQLAPAHPAGPAPAALDAAELVAIQARAAGALARLAEADRVAAAGLRRLATLVRVPAGTGAAATAGLLGAALAGGRLPPAGTGTAGGAPGGPWPAPGVVAAWWAALPPVRRRVLLAAQPGQLGALDGLPLGLRDRASRAALALERERLAATRAALARRLAAAGGADAMARELLLLDLVRVGRRRAALARLAAAGGLLLLFDPAGDGRAAVAFGDPATAANVAVVVPGMGTTIDNFGRTLTNAANLHAEVRDLYADQPAAAHAAHATAVVAWLGYDAPDPAQAVDDRLARQGAPELRRFVDGLRTTHDGARPHLTVSAHSYGSTLTGFAARDGRLAADDIAVVGSPGLGRGITTAGELHLDPATTLWAGRAADDPIRLVQLTDAPRRALDVLLPGPLEPPPEPWLRHGSDPSLPGFGAHRFATGGASGHSAYFRDAGSLRNLGYIAAGDAALVTLAAGGAG
jgi:uncharacterized protein YukE